MLQWHRQPDRTKLTLTARSPTGHTFKITSTGVMTPVHLSVQPPTERTGTRASTVPTIPLAKLCAEELNMYNLRADAHGAAEDGASQQRRKLAQEALTDLTDGPKDHFVIEVPRTQSLTAQYALPQAGLVLGMEAHFPPEGYRTSRLVPESGIRQAAAAVNAELQTLDIRPALRLPPLFADVERPQQWLDFMHREFRWNSSAKITRHLWQERGDAWADVAERYPEIMETPAAARAERNSPGQFSA